MEIRRIFPLVSGLAVFVCICWAFSALYTSPFNTKSVQAYEADARVDAVTKRVDSDTTHKSTTQKVIKPTQEEPKHRVSEQARIYKSLEQVTTPENISQEVTEPPRPQVIYVQSEAAEESIYINEMKPRQKLIQKPIIHYRDLTSCPRPQYLPDYKAFCWGKCHDGQQCSEVSMSDDIAEGRATLKCFENFFIIGVRKCGTTDISNYFLRLENVVGNKRGHFAEIGAEDYYPDRQCPMDYFGRRFPKSSVSKSDRIYHYGPGTILSNDLYVRNATHMVVSPASQFLGFMAPPEARFHIQLRHPTERAISYLFHWQGQGWIFKDLTHEQFSKDFTDYLLLGMLEELKGCIRDLGELACIYLDKGADGVLPNLLLHSLYAIYIEEAFKFIPREQFIFTTINEYSKSEEDTMKKVMGFFGIKYVSNVYNKAQAASISNKGKKNPVADHVKKALDEFYEPYTRRLAKLLKDDKFLFNMS